MQTKNNVTGLKIAILSMSLLQMATNAIASVIADIAASFPDVPVSTVQYLMTFPNLFLVISSLVCARLTVKIPKKWIAVTGLCLGLAAGALSFLFHGSIVLLYIWAAVLGCCMGSTAPMANGLIAEYFDGKERDSMLGLQTSASNLGSMIMTFAGGYLALLGWHYVYWVYFLGIPGIILTLLFVPGKKKTDAAADPVPTMPEAGSKEGRKRIPGTAYIYFAIAFFYMICFYVGPTNLALIVQERVLGTTVLSGNAATVLLAGGVVMGLLFGKAAAKIGKFTISCGFFALVLGYLLIFFFPSVPVLYIGSFLIGISNTLVLPQTMGSVVTADNDQSTMLMAICLAFANVGMFLAPAVTGISEKIMGNALSSSRFLFTGILSFIFMIASIIILSILSRHHPGIIRTSPSEEEDTHNLS